MKTALLSVFMIYTRLRPVHERVDIAYDNWHLQKRYIETPYIIDICITKLEAYNNV